MQEYMHKTWDGPMSEDDKTWLRTWDQHALIQANEEEFLGEVHEEIVDRPDPTVKSALDPTADQRAVTEVLPDEDEDDEDDYDDWKVSELQAEVDKRNAAGSEIEVSGTGRDGKVLKADLIAALRADDNTEE